MEFTGDELRLLNNALNEVLNGPDAIEEWEFHARMGGTRDDAGAVLRRLGEALGR